MCPTVTCTVTNTTKVVLKVNILLDNVFVHIETSNKPLFIISYIFGSHTSHYIYTLLKLSFY